MIAAERETTVTVDDDDRVVRIYTCRRTDITALSRKLTPTRSGAYLDGTRWAEFVIPAAGYSIARGIRTPRGPNTSRGTSVAGNRVSSHFQSKQGHSSPTDPAPHEHDAGDALDEDPEGDHDDDLEGDLDVPLDHTDTTDTTDTTDRLEA